MCVCVCVLGKGKRNSWSSMFSRPFDETATTNPHILPGYTAAYTPAAVRVEVKVNWKPPSRVEGPVSSNLTRDGVGRFRSDRPNASRSACSATVWLRWGGLTRPAQRSAEPEEHATGAVT